jgi:Ser-tRNA(Ala) deacylase AlaX
VYFGFVALHGPAERCDRSVTTRSASVDLRYGEPETVKVDVLEEWLVRVVADDLLITVVTHQGRRYWHVDGIGTSACSGLHPESTRHVGDVDVAVEPHAGSGLRLSVHLAQAAEPDLEESP